ncbi:MAG TPA: hypothetical protein VF303_00750 [Candidatus Nanoarchaeia archaeon]
MKNIFKKSPDPCIVGLLQALGVTIYSVLIGGFFYFMQEVSATPGFLGIVLMLILLIFSAAVTGSTVFGYPAYLALNKKIKEALSVLAYTLLYSLGIILIITIVVIVLSS